jgi:hypothetical protein
MLSTRIALGKLGNFAVSFSSKGISFPHLSTAFMHWLRGTGFREQSVHIQGTFSAHCTLREHSMHIAGRDRFLPAVVISTVEHLSGSASLVSLAALGDQFLPAAQRDN